MVSPGLPLLGSVKLPFALKVVFVTVFQLPNGDARFVDDRTFTEVPEIPLVVLRVMAPPARPLKFAVVTEGSGNTAVTVTVPFATN